MHIQLEILREEAKTLNWLKKFIIHFYDLDMLNKIHITSRLASEI